MRKRCAAILVGLVAAGLVVGSLVWRSHRAKPISSGERLEWVDPGALQPGPIRHEQLSEKQLERIKLLHQIFAEVDPSSLETWIDNFKRDANPDRELEIWERMARAYRRFTAPRQLSPAEKKEAFGLILTRSMATPDETLARFKLESLSPQDARRIVEEY